MSQLAPEALALFNPALTAVVLSAAARDFRVKAGRHFPFSMAFIVVPLALHRPFRSELPSRANARMAGWLLSHPQVRADFPTVAQSFVPIAREGLRAGLESESLGVEGETLVGLVAAEPLEAMSDDTVEIRTKARFLGRWAAASGDPAVIFKLFGVRP